MKKGAGIILFMILSAGLMGQEKGNIEKATLGGGCFWCVEAIFKQVRGVGDVTSGFSGGLVESPSYEQVVSGTTGHAEVVQLVFDPQVITYRDIIEIFMDTHDPTSLNRQGADVGTQYRSVIFYHSREQERTAREVIREIQPLYPRPVVTFVEPFDAFYAAEAYHQDYYEQNKMQPYCQVVISPKLRKFRKDHSGRIK